MAVAFIAAGIFDLAGGGGTDTVSLPGTPVEDDIVIVTSCSDGASPDPSVVTSGYTQLHHETGAVRGDIAYKRMGATPDTQIELNLNGSTQQQTGILQTFSGVDTTTAIDNSYNSATDISGDPDPPSHTTSNDDAYRIIIGFLDDDTVASSVSAPSGFTNPSANEVTGAGQSTIMMASKAGGTAGADDPAAFSTSGGDAWFSAHFALREAAAAGVTATPAKADLTITGQAPALTVSVKVAPAKADLTITGQTPSLAMPLEISPAKGDLTISTSTPTVEATLDLEVAPAKADLTITPSTPTVEVVAGITALPAKADLTISTSTPTVGASEHIAKAPAKADLTITGQTPSASVGGAIGALPAKADLTITTSTPTVVAGTDAALEPAKADLTITASTPTVGTGVGTTIIPAKADLVIAGQVPGENILPVAKGDLTITGQTPVVVRGSERFPAVASLSISTSAPTVFNSSRIYANPPYQPLSLHVFDPHRATTYVIAKADLVITGYVASPGLGQVPREAALLITTYAPEGEMLPAKADLTITGYAPALSYVIVKADLTITGYAPTIKRDVTPETAALVITTYAPAAERPMFPAGATLTITGYAPEITMGTHQDAAQLVITGQIPGLTNQRPWFVEDGVTGTWIPEWTLCDGVRDETHAEADADVDP